MDPQNDPGKDVEAQILAAVTPPRQQMGPPESPPQAPGEPIGKDRFDEVLTELRNTQRQVDILTRAAVSGRQAPAAATNQEPLDPALRETLTPYLQGLREEIMGQLAPVVGYVQREIGMREVNKNIPQFSEIQSEAKQLWSSMPPEEQAKYDSDVGAMALAGMVLSRRLAAMQQPSGSMNPDRAHSVPRGTMAPSGGPSNGEDLARMIRDPDAFPSDRFDGLRGRMLGNG